MAVMENRPETGGARGQRILLELQGLYIPGWDYHVSEEDENWILEKAKEIAATGKGDRSLETIQRHARSGLIFEFGSTQMIGAYPNPLEHDPIVLESYDHDSRIHLQDEIRLEFKKVNEKYQALNLNLSPNNQGYPSVKQQIKEQSSCDLLIFGWTNEIENSHYKIYWKWVVYGPSLSSMVMRTKHTRWGSSHFYMDRIAKSNSQCIELNPVSGAIVE
jgi:hypothetical protein